MVVLPAELAVELVAAAGMSAPMGSENPPATGVGSGLAGPVAVAGNVSGAEPHDVCVGTDAFTCTGRWLTPTANPRCFGYSR